VRLLDFTPGAAPDGTDLVNVKESRARTSPTAWCASTGSSP